MATNCTRPTTRFSTSRRGLPRPSIACGFQSHNAGTAGKDIKDYGGHRKYLNPLGLVNVTDFWEDTAPARHRRFKARWHINELKPMIPSRCFDIATNPGDVILDPFGGGGSSYEAAQRLGRQWLGTEIVSAAPIQERFGRLFPELKPRLPRRLRRVFTAPAGDFSISIP